ncbi:MAG: DNA-protecting protein DprA [Firmicutes bacterium]|mgnify:CR=1 FL=1|nr:DNA-protecting protein DprA [Bacillota bacterium]
MLTDEALYWIALHKAPGIGPKRFYRLLAVFGTARAAWEAEPRALVEVLGRKVAADLVAFRRTCAPAAEGESVQKAGCRVLLACDSAYPVLLKQTSDPPPVLYYKGEFKPSDQLAVAIVGSRRATPRGLNTARELAADLAAQGVTIVSGLARGIDSAAHRGALQVEGGRTIAVLGSGLDQVYPPENAGLMQAIAERGVVCSEFPLGTPPYAANFPARNRVISGLSLAVTVVEATADSGSLITADFALEQGRDVFAVPGPVEREGSKGPHRLIKQGAFLVEGPNDILAALNLPLLAVEASTAAQAGPDLALSPVEQQIWDLLAAGETHVDDLVRASGLPAAAVNSALVMMEMKKVVSQVAAKTYRRNR